MISIVGETRPYMKVVYDVYAGKRDVSELENLATKADELMASPQKKKGGLFSFGEVTTPPHSGTRVWFWRVILHLGAGTRRGVADELLQLAVPRAVGGGAGSAGGGEEVSAQGGGERVREVPRLHVVSRSSALQGQGVAVRRGGVTCPPLVSHKLNNTFVVLGSAPHVSPLMCIIVDPTLRGKATV